jgi:hypothetical protein
MTAQHIQPELRIIETPKPVLFFKDIVIKIINRHILQNTFRILKQHMTQSKTE